MQLNSDDELEGAESLDTHEEGLSGEEEGEETPAEPIEAEDSQGEQSAAGSPAGETGALNEEDRRDIKAAIEAILFAATEPLSAPRIAKCIPGADGRFVRTLLWELAGEYEEARRGFLLEEVAGGFRLYSRPEYHTNVEKLFRQRPGVRLSTAAVETLAIVAYKQPITRAEIEDIRGVAVGPVLRNLLDLSLAKIVGRAEVLGRPLLYGTTKKFLEQFGLKSLRDLPKSEDFQAAAAAKAIERVPAEDVASVALQTAIETSSISPDGIESAGEGEEEERE